MVIFLATISLLTTQASAEPSLGACAWAELPVAEQQAVLTAYDRSISSGMRALSQRDSVLQTSVHSCAGRSDLPAILTQASISSHVIQLGAANAVHREKGLGRVELDAAWSEAPNAARACALNNAAKPFRIDGPVCPDRNASRAFLEKLDLSSSNRNDRVAAEQALIYMNAKAQQEIADRLIATAPNTSR